MKYVEYKNLSKLDAIEDGIRKPGNNGTPYYAMNRCKHLRVYFDGVERRIDCGKELLPQSGSLHFIPTIGAGQTRPNPATEHDRQGHQPRRA